jgi:hypothetical protein
MRPDSFRERQQEGGSEAERGAESEATGERSPKFAPGNANVEFTPRQLRLKTVSATLSVFF